MVSVKRNHEMPWFWSLWSFLDETAPFTGKYMNLAVGYLFTKIFFTSMKASFYFSEVPKTWTKEDISVLKEELLLPKQLVPTLKRKKKSREL